MRSPAPSSASCAAGCRSALAVTVLAPQTLPRTAYKTALLHVRGPSAAQGSP
jgi:hypothetical protein